MQNGLVYLSQSTESKILTAFTQRIAKLASKLIVNLVFKFV